MGKRELVALLCLSFWFLMIVVWLVLTMPWVCMQFVIVVFPDHTHLLLLSKLYLEKDFHIGNLKPLLLSTHNIYSLC